eukprot:CAMPEP_0116866770 /NCGR_PEP_ID=MMETSP0418-20121206/26232_1 /TAXON_ID=1158023 /ORGANISM="Astrosyne radiata, Strain 13vi08-1A" /LENGTH=67 /DNA_ID=CAMNT_0004502479 /DNA_START=61 /DNA_END=261 /DNA_ORIENTATION=+
MKPCTIAFHSVSEVDDGNSIKASTVCSGSNQLNEDDHHLPTIKAYVQNFYDECVGDFPRCYHAERDA